MHSHVVLYKTNPNNPQAAAQIVSRANHLFGRLNSLPNTHFHAAVIPTPIRAVGEDDYQVMMNFMFPNEGAYQHYMEDASHKQFVSFVLRGWRIKGDSGEDAGDRFIDYIMHAAPDEPAEEQERDPFIPEDEVVWADERVIDA